MSNKEAEKAKRERQIFSLFASQNDWPVGDGLVESRSPPEPDILYHAVSGDTAFELAEICASDVAHQTAKLKAQGGVSVIWTSDPTEEIFRNKLTKSYSSKHPIELLCYWRGNVISPDSQVCAKIKDLCTQIGTNGYRRIWYYGEKAVYKIFEQPDLS